MKTLICTPAAGGMVTTTYLMSLISTFYSSKRLRDQQKYSLGVYTMANESLISRGRNHCATVVLDGGWDRLFFVDADVGYTWDQMQKVLDACDASKGRGIVAGACPLKTYPIGLNFLPFPEDEAPFEKFDMMKDPRAMLGMRALHNGAELVEVPMIGTAFMCIDRQVFEDLKATQNYYAYPDPDSGNLSPHWDFFPVGPIKNRFISEDWGFCHVAREAGHKVWVHTDVVVTHTGAHTFMCNFDEMKREVLAEKPSYPSYGTDHHAHAEHAPEIHETKAP